MFLFVALVETVFFFTLDLDLTHDLDCEMCNMEYMRLDARFGTPPCQSGYDTLFLK